MHDKNTKFIMNIFGFFILNIYIYTIDDKIQNYIYETQYTINIRLNIL